ncbi:MAG: polymer-forming cytoskeletal protein [Anaerolineae bacterium]
MTFLRRGRNSVDEYRRSREAFGRTIGVHAEQAARADQDEPPITEADVSEIEETVELPDAAHDSMLEALRQNSTAVARDTSFSGTLKSDSNLYIEGRFEGELQARETIVIAEGAEVKAGLDATNVIVAGVLDGKVDASGRFHAMPSAHVAGDINTAILVIDQGSHVSCRFAMKPRKD